METTLFREYPQTNRFQDRRIYPVGNRNSKAFRLKPKIKVLKAPFTPGSRIHPVVDRNSKAFRLMKII